MEFINWLQDLSKSDLALAGGKGANLAELVRTGVLVPPGFVVTTRAYCHFVAECGLQTEIDRIALQADPQRPATIEEASSAIRALFAQGIISDAISLEIIKAYTDLGEGAVAVRSSATAEDLPEASFAGQQETFLNIEGPEALLEAVRKCWSSLWTARSIAYRARQGIEPSEVSLAVIIQRQIPAEVAGILFTANPVNGRRDQIVVDAAWGLGEAVVSGQVAPDHWVLDYATGDILEARTGVKTLMTVQTDQGTALVPVKADLQEWPVLDVAKLTILSNLARRITSRFGSPQDIEWAIAENMIYLLQSRPITSLFPIPIPQTSPDTELRIFACVNYLQGFPEPFTPLGISAFRMFSHGGAKVFGGNPAPGVAPAIFKTAAGRIYFDVTAAIRNARSRRAVLALPGVMDQPMAAIFRTLIAREQSLSPIGARFPLRPPFSLILAIFGRILMTVIAPGLGRKRARAAAEKYIKRIEAKAAAVTGVEERHAFFLDEGSDLLPTVAGHLIPLAIPAIGSRFLTEEKVRNWLGDTSGFQPLLRSLPYNPTTEMDLALWRVSRKLKNEGTTPSAWNEMVQEFLAAYGHRGVREIDIGMPRWREDPSPILSILNNYLGHEEKSDPEARFEQGIVEAARASDELVNKVRLKKGRLRATALRFLISRIRALLGTRELPKFLAIKAFSVYREVALGAGKDLVETGRLDDPNDVIYLDVDDLITDKDLRALAAENRVRYQREILRRAVPRVITNTGETFYGAAEVKEGALVGTPASPGIFEGRVRVVFDPRGAQLERGEILVAPGTDPAWTPLFLTAGALVMEIGGVMSHGSVVAREYGIPAVVGVTGATEKLSTGQRVRVDGESGLVLPLD